MVEKNKKICNNIHKIRSFSLHKNTLEPLTLARSSSVETGKSRGVTFLPGVKEISSRINNHTHDISTSNHYRRKAISHTKYPTKRDATFNTILQNKTQTGKSNTHSDLKSSAGPHTSPPPKSDLIKAIEKIIT